MKKLLILLVLIAASVGLYVAYANQSPNTAKEPQAQATKAPEHVQLAQNVKPMLPSAPACKGTLTAGSTACNAKVPDTIKLSPSAKPLENSPSRVVISAKTKACYNSLRVATYPNPNFSTSFPYGSGALSITLLFNKGTSNINTIMLKCSDSTCCHGGVRLSYYNHG